MKTFLFSLHPRIRGISRIFCNEDLFYGLHCWIWGKKVFVPPLKLFMPRPPSHTTVVPSLPDIYIFLKKSDVDFRHIASKNKKKYEV